MRFIVGLVVLACFVFSCMPPKKELVLSYKKADFEKEVNGKRTLLYTLKNENGVLVTLTNYGAKIVSIFVPDRNGDFEDIALGCPSIDGYIKGNAGLGAVVGPYEYKLNPLVC